MVACLEDTVSLGGAAQPLRVLVANEHAARLEEMGVLVRNLGHEVVARELHPAHVAQATREEQPDVAIVGVGEHGEHALSLITGIVHEASCPVIVVLHSPDSVFAGEAARRGVFAQITDGSPDELQTAISIALERHGQLRSLKSAFGRRMLIERAKGILMERHGIDEREAFELLRRQSRTTGTKVAELAEAITSAHPLLPKAAAARVRRSSVSDGY